MQCEVGSVGVECQLRCVLKESGEAIIRLENDERSCCYFASGRPSVTVDGRAQLSTLSFFKGAEPRGGLFIQNERAGILYLRFNFH
jgi:hypothetical protein